MIQNNANLNTGRAVANNGQDFYEDTSAHTGEWFGFMPHTSGCIVAEITITNGDGESIDQTHADVSSWIGTTANLDSFMGAGLVKKKKGYITSIKLTSGAITLYRDTIAKQ
jgi:hypothetical protein